MHFVTLRLKGLSFCQTDFAETLSNFSRGLIET